MVEQREKRSREDDVRISAPSSSKRKACASTSDSAGGAEDTDLDCLLSQLPSDTLATIIMLRNKFPRKIPTCPLVIKSHVYSVIKDRTDVDRQLEELNRNNKIQIIKLSSDYGNDYGIALWEDYSAVVNACKNDKASEECKIIDWFLEGLVSQMSHCYVSDYQLELELREFLRSIDKDADTYDEYITLFMRSGLLNRRISVHGGYWISVPNVGVFVKSLNAGRKRLAGVVKRRKRNEMLLWDLEKMKLPGLGMRYLVRDAIGSGMFQQVSCVCVCGGVGILFQIFTPDFLFLCLFADRNYLRAVAAFVQKEFMKGW